MHCFAKMEFNYLAEYIEKIIMKKLFLLFSIVSGLSLFGQTSVFVNEIHYDNVGTDEGESF